MIEKTNPTAPASPTDHQSIRLDLGGLSKRELIAIEVLSGIMAMADMYPSKGKANDMAKAAIIYTDALIQQLNNETCTTLQQQ